MTAYEVAVVLLVVGLFAVISLLPLFTSQDDNSLVQRHE
jgi:uncharacterized membrane protein YuzA (DUF378 family)